MCRGDKGSADLCTRACLYALRQDSLEGSQVGEQHQAHKEDHQHNAQLEVCIQGCGKHLSQGQKECLAQNKTIPEPVWRPAKS